MPPRQDNKDNDSSDVVEKTTENKKKDAFTPGKKKKKADFLLDSSSDSDSSSSESSDSDDDNNDNNKTPISTKKYASSIKSEPKKSILKINSAFAKKFQEQKQREELINVRQERKLKALNGQLDDEDNEDAGSSSDESEDEDADQITPGVDLQILKTINALRKKDKSVYDSKTRFFEEVPFDNDDDDDSQKIKKHKSKFYKDVVREQIVEKMNRDKNENDQSDDDDHEKNDDDYYDTNLKSKLEYDEEQMDLRKAFLDSNEKSDDENNEDGDDWLIQKKGKHAEKIDPEHEKLVQKELELLEKQSTNNEAETSFDGKENTDKFLFDFIKNKRWVDKSVEMNHEDDSDFEDEEVDTNKQQLILSSNGDDSDASLDELEKMDQFESKYNFRFEEAAANNGASGAGYSVVGYSRASLSNTIRRQDDTRKQKRLQRKERKEAERKAKEEQLRRLKNAKRQEMEERLKEIQSVLGDKNIEMEGENNVDEETMMKLMEGDYDPEKFDELMNKNYGDRYYDEEEQEWKNDADVKEALKNNEEDVVLDEGAQDGGLYDDFEEAVDADDANVNHQDMEYGEDDEQYYEAEDEKSGNKREETQLEKKLKEKMLDELYKLDYEDLIGDMPTRFKYRKVEANMYGLRTEEILYSRDTTLKQFVSLKKMAPYSEDGEYHPDTRKRRRFRDMAKQDYEEMVEENELQQQAENEEREKNAPAKKKRRRQKKGKKKDKTEENDGSDEITKQDVDGIAKTSGHDEDTEGKKKRRKKKGKKLDKKAKESGDRDNHQSESNDVIKIPSLPLKTEDSDVKPKKTKRKRGKDKKRNKEESSKGGISASRLASYGL